MALGVGMFVAAGLAVARRPDLPRVMASEDRPEEPAPDSTDPPPPTGAAPSAEPTISIERLTVEDWLADEDEPLWLAVPFDNAAEASNLGLGQGGRCGPEALEFQRATGATIANNRFSLSVSKVTGTTPAVSGLSVADVAEAEQEKSFLVHCDNGLGWEAAETTMLDLTVGTSAAVRSSDHDVHAVPPTGDRSVEFVLDAKVTVGGTTTQQQLGPQVAVRSSYPDHFLHWVGGGWTVHETGSMGDSDAAGATQELPSSPAEFERLTEEGREPAPTTELPGCDDVEQAVFDQNVDSWPDNAPNLRACADGWAWVTIDTGMNGNVMSGYYRVDGQRWERRGAWAKLFAGCAPEPPSDVTAGFRQAVLDDAPDGICGPGEIMSDEPMPSDPGE